MPLTKSRKIIIIIIGIIVVLVLFAKVFLQRFDANVTLANKSSSEIKTLTVRLCSESASTNNFAPQEIRYAELKITKDCGYDVEVVFGDGRTLNKKVGYISVGLEFQDIIIIKDQDIEFDRQKYLN